MRIVFILLIGGNMVNSVEIIKGVIPPEPKRRYPYSKMDVNDSFFVEGGKLQLICNYNYRASKRLGYKFMARQEKDGIRVWRVE